ncbi:MAG: ferrous iron transport protein A [Syntrophomonadaceae bacterium]|nr:ferrous iron transport protein A [Syntrophomonadaceae bacterium]
MTLRDMKVGQKAKIIKIDKGSYAQRRLFEIGLVPGAEVKLLSRHPFRGPLVLQIGNAKIAVGRGIAASVKIELLEN